MRSVGVSTVQLAMTWLIISLCVWHILVSTSLRLGVRYYCKIFHRWSLVLRAKYSTVRICAFLEPGAARPYLCSGLWELQYLSRFHAAPQLVLESACFFFVMGALLASEVFTSLVNWYLVSLIKSLKPTMPLLYTDISLESHSTSDFGWMVKPMDWVHFLNPFFFFHLFQSMIPRTEIVRLLMTEIMFFELNSDEVHSWIICGYHFLHRRVLNSINFFISRLLTDAVLTRLWKVILWSSWMFQRFNIATAVSRACLSWYPSSGEQLV